MSRRKNSPQQLRIIGGKHKGRKLRFHGDPAIRPTLGRTRETLFNWLRPDIFDATILDAYAGSGALGFEALSQGAKKVTMLENNPRTCKVIQTNIDDLQANSACQVIKTDTLNYLSTTSDAYDVVFLDPPFDSPDLLMKTIGCLLQRQLVRHYIYAEAQAMATLTKIENAFGIHMSREAKSGDTFAGLFTLDN